VLASLYPAVTVLLAMTIDGERINRAQVAGLALATAAITFCAV
jgi:drug/metabolite transporter (DMT)-like permease